MPLETVLHNRGIDDVEQFLKAQDDITVTDHYSKLNNIDKAVDCLLKHIGGGNKTINVWTKIDPDVDGISSSTLLIRYLKQAFPNIDITYALPNGKEHGFKSEEVPNDIDLCIIPDSSSNDYDVHKELYDRNIDLIILDHHEADKESEHAIVVNNQLSPQFTNKYLSAVGVVYLFCKAIDERLNTNYADDYLDLVFIGIVGDSMSMIEPANRYYVSQGSKNIRNPLLKALFEAQEYSTKGIININSASFYINPLFNSCFRMGTKEELSIVVKAILSEQDETIVNSKGEKENIHDYTIKLMKRVRVRQNKLRDTGVAAIEERIKEKNLLDNKVLIVNVTDILDTNLTGLVAGKLANSNHIKRPVLLLRQIKDTNTFGGSGRNVNNGEIEDFRGFLEETGKFEFVRGHSAAFGHEIKAKNLIEVNNIINEQLKDVEIDTNVYEVDFELTTKELRYDLIHEISSHKDLWGKDIEEPYIAIKNITIEKRNINLIGKNKNVLKFKTNDIEYIKFFSNQEEYNELMSIGNDGLSGTLEIDVVGRVDINEFRGKKTGQVVIEDYNAKEKENVFAF